VHDESSKGREGRVASMVGSPRRKPSKGFHRRQRRQRSDSCVSIEPRGRTATEAGHSMAGEAPMRACHRANSGDNLPIKTWQRVMILKPQILHG